MATLKKTSIRRFNGTDWDTIYLATSADITYLGAAITVADNTTAWAKNDVIPATDTVNSLLAKIVNRIQYIDNTVIPGHHTNIYNDVANANKNNTDYVSKLNVGDIVVTTDGYVWGVAAKPTATTATWVALTDSTSDISWSRISGRPTTVTNTAADASDRSKLYLTNVVLTGDLIDTNSATPSSDAGKAVKLNADGKLGFSITGDAATLESHNAAYFATKSWADGIDTAIGDDSTAGTIKGRIKAIETWDSSVDTALNLTQVIAGTGTLPIGVIPKAAVERLYEISTISILSDKTATGYPTDATDGDTILAADTAQMYYIKDATKLGTANYEQGIAAYQAGKASSVEWANVLNTPTTIDGYGITDAVNVSEKVTSATAANAGKILVLNSNGKLDVSITGDAATLEGHNAAYFATDSDMTALETRVGMDDTSGLSKRIKDLENAVGDSSTADTIIYRLDAIEDAIGEDSGSTSTGIYKDIYDLQQGTTIAHLNASVIDTGTVSRDVLPSDIGGKTYSGTGYETLAASKTTLAGLTSNKPNNGDLLLTGDGNLYMITNTAALAQDGSYTLLYGKSTQAIAWSQITVSTRPTTITKTAADATDATKLYLTNAIITSDVVDDAINSTTGAGDTGKAGKLVAVNSDGKLHADVTHLGGKAASYYDIVEYTKSQTLPTTGVVNGTFALMEV